jgi:hypothetical protein
MPSQLGRDPQAGRFRFKPILDAGSPKVLSLPLGEQRQITLLVPPAPDEGLVLPFLACCVARGTLMMLHWDASDLLEGNTVPSRC